MPANQSARQQKRSRLSDAAFEKPARANDERSKRRRVSGANGNNSKTTESSKAVTVSSSDVQTQDAETKQKNPAPWSFSRPIGGRYTNLDPILTQDET
jgi:NET1-associated nuclear protein 1 (U3 small nucleolar RNA-associated protein 17)